MSSVEAEELALTEAKAEQKVKKITAQGSRRQPQVSLGGLEREERRTQPELDYRWARDAQQSNEQTSQTYFGNPRVEHREEKGGGESVGKEERQELEKDARANQKKIWKEEREEERQKYKMRMKAQEKKQRAQNEKQRANREREEQREKYNKRIEEEKRTAREERQRVNEERAERKLTADEERQRVLNERQRAMGERWRAEDAEEHEASRQRTREFYFGDKHRGRGKHQQ